MSAVSSPVNPATPPAPALSSPASPCRAPVATCRLPTSPFKLLHCANFSCDNWFHPKCVNIDEDKVDLLDVYICEACEPSTSQRTRYKRFCKRDGCERQAAPSSKYALHHEDTADPRYCSSRCALQVAQAVASGLDKKTTSEISRSLSGYPAPAPAVSVQLADGSQPSTVSPSHAALVANLRSQMSELERQMDLVTKRQTLLSQAVESWEALPLVLVEVPARRKNKSKRREMETVEVRPCGWDARLLWDDVAVEAWDGSQGDGALCDGGKRCDRHQGWQKTVAAGLDVEGAVIVSFRSLELQLTEESAEAGHGSEH